MAENRFVVGIDLGTTNSTVAYVDMTDADGQRPAICKFPIYQLTGPGEFAPLPALPSFLYIPGEYDITDQDMAAPWTVDQRSLDDRNVVGAFARDHGAKVPARLVSSAKSWLCNRQVDTRSRILPWGSGNEVVKVSPVQASAAYLKHIRKAWNMAMGDDEEGYLENQLIILTVPASFDEVARDLTLEAARMAGLTSTVLLEEPLAAFYHWLSAHERDWSDHVDPNQLILVCDVGGGTTDFTLIALQSAEGSPRFERIAVGDHLILGGDNMDFAIARAIAHQLGQSPNAMAVDTWKALCHQCRQNKERMLGGTADSGRITVMGSGSNLIGGTMSAPINRRAIEAIVLDGFFPTAGSSDRSAALEGDASWGLNYETDTAITGHLGRFLNRHQADVAAATGRSTPYPDLILFNGGALKPSVLRNRIAESIRHHFKRNTVPANLSNPEMDLAVSLGAAYYGMVKAGIGVRVGSGSPRSYYIGVSTNTGNGRQQAVCMVERGLEEGSAISLPDHAIKVLTNQPVAIDLFSSSFRSGDRSGDLVDVDDTLSALPSLNTVIQFGKKGLHAEIPIRLEATYTEVGTLEIWCQATETPHRWQLRFQLRSMAGQEEVAENEVFEASVVDAAKQAIRSAFASDEIPSRLAQLMSDIGGIVGRSKEDWPLSLLRDMADTLLAEMAIRSQSAQAECRWMNMLGFCLRPGTGEGFDRHRVKALWKVYKKGPVHANAPQVRAEWWILWRRVAAGLTAGQQRQFYQDVSSRLMSPKRSRIPLQEYMEMWMALGSMERLHVGDKSTLGGQLVAQFKLKKPPLQLLWTLSRIGARELLYGPIDRVVPPAEIADWLETILSIAWKNPKPVVEMLSQLCRKTGDPLRDVTATARHSATQWIDAAGDFSEALARVNTVAPRKAKETNAVFGEALPAGLIFHART